MTDTDPHAKCQERIERYRKATQAYADRLATELGWERDASIAGWRHINGQTHHKCLYATDLIERELGITP